MIHLKEGQSARGRGPQTIEVELPDPLTIGPGESIRVRMTTDAGTATSIDIWWDVVAGRWRSGSRAD